VRRDTGKPVRRISGSNFIPLGEDILPPADARAMIHRYLWNPEHLLALHGIRSLSRQDPGYNNVSMIDSGRLGRDPELRPRRHCRK
jgi:hypothetical protein